MSRIRSRESESDIVNSRMLKTDAVERRHIGRWAIGEDELQPGVVGEAQLGPGAVTEVSLGSRVIEQLAAGEHVTVAIAEQAIPAGGAFVQLGAEAVEPYRVGFDDLMLPAAYLPSPVDALWAVHLELDGSNHDGNWTVEIYRDDVLVAPSHDVWTGSGMFDVTVLVGRFVEDAQLKVKLIPDTGPATLTSGTLMWSLLDRTRTRAPEEDVVEPARFLVYGSSGNVSQSVDGLTWSTLWGASDPFGDDRITSMIYVEELGRWWATTINRFGWSNDGLTWNIVSGFDPGGGVLAYGAGVYVLRRDDGIWSNPDPTNTAGWVQRVAYTSFAYGVAFGNDVFVAHDHVGGSGAAGSVIRTSPDGIAWTQQAVPDPSMGDFVWFAGGLFFVSGGGEMFVSADGVTWTSGVASALLGSHNVFALTHHDGLFVALAFYSTGDDLKILTSPDGYVWTLQTLPAGLASWTYSSPQAPDGIVWGDGVWVAPLQAGGGNTTVRGVLTSGDGVTWEWTELSRHTNGVSEGGAGFGYSAWTPDGIVVGPRDGG